MFWFQTTRHSIRQSQRGGGSAWRHLVWDFSSQRVEHRRHLQGLGGPDQAGAGRSRLDKCVRSNYSIEWNKFESKLATFNSLWCIQQGRGGGKGGEGGGHLMYPFKKLFKSCVYKYVNKAQASGIPYLFFHSPNQNNSSKNSSIHVKKQSN